MGRLATIRALLKASDANRFDVAVCNALADALTEAGAPSKVIASVLSCARSRLTPTPYLFTLSMNAAWIFQRWVNESKENGTL